MLNKVDSRKVLKLEQSHTKGGSIKPTEKVKRREPHGTVWARAKQVGHPVNRSL